MNTGKISGGGNNGIVLFNGNNGDESNDDNSENDVKNNGCENEISSEQSVNEEFNGDNAKKIDDSENSSSDSNGKDSNQEDNKNNINIQNAVAENDKEATNDGVGGGDETASSENEDDVTYIKRKVSFVKPLENGKITSRYGLRQATEIVSGNHKGVDIGAPYGSEIKAAMDGTVELVLEEGDYGKHIKIVDGEVSTLYAHCSKIVVNQGDYVKKGQKIAEVGSTGKSTGPHLHFEIRRNNLNVNPEDILSLQ